MSGFYVYEWFDPRIKLPFYIGMGSGPRAWRISRNPRTLNRYKKLLKLGYKQEGIIKIVKNDITQEAALMLETELIKKYGIVEEGGILLNFRKDSNSGGSYSKLRGDSLKHAIYLYEKEKLTSKEIGEFYNIHETSVLRILRLNGVKIKQTGFSTTGRNEIISNIDYYVQLRSTGTSYAKIAKKLHCSVPTVIRAFEDALGKKSCS
jgi:hypothetical protein